MCCGCDFFFVKDRMKCQLLVTNCGGITSILVRRIYHSLIETRVSGHFVSNVLL